MSSPENENSGASPQDTPQVPLVPSMDVSDDTPVASMGFDAPVKDGQSPDAALADVVTDMGLATAPITTGIKNEPEPLITATTNPNFTMKRSPIRPQGHATTQLLAKANEFVVAALVTRSDFGKAMEAHRFFPEGMNGDDQDIAEKLSPYQRAIVGAAYSSVDTDIFLPDTTPGSQEWQTSLEHNGVPLMHGRQQYEYDAKASMTPVAGAAAVQRITDRLGLGNNVWVPLYASGIWLKIGTCPDTRLGMLEEAISQTKSVLGRNTLGLALSHSNIYIVMHLVEMIMENVQSGNVLDISSTTLLDNILLPDLYTLAWGQGCAIYPNGYRLHQVCVARPGICDEVTVTSVNPYVMIAVDRKRFSKEDVGHMAVMQKPTYTSEDIKKYQAKRLKRLDNIIDIQDGIKFELRIPTLQEHVNEGTAWFQEVENLVAKMVGIQMTDHKRQQALQNQVNYSAIRQYSSWISKIHDNGYVMETREDIIRTLEMMASNEELSTVIIDKIQGFITKATPCIHPLPKTACPKCKAPHYDEGETHQEQIPQDTVSLFFTLTRQRLSKKKTG